MLPVGCPAYPMNRKRLRRLLRYFINVVVMSRLGVVPACWSSYFTSEIVTPSGKEALSGDALLQ